MADIRGTFGRFDVVDDGVEAGADPFVYGVFGRFREVQAEASPTVFPGVFTAVIQYQPPMLQPIPAQVVGY